MRHLLLCVFILTIFNFSIAQDFDVLVFSKTEGFRHSSIESGQSAIQELGDENNFTVTLSENADDFTLENLAQYEAIVFLSTTGNILNTTQQEAFETYISQGGGYVGIHAASDTEYEWEWYGGLVGAYFESHPSIQEATIEVADRIHPSTSFLGDYWERRDEWYDYRENPRGDVHVLATLDESTYGGGGMGHDHPIAWCHEYEGGRSWYTGGGHTEESYSETAFLQHILGGIQYAAGQIVGDYTATISEKFEMKIIDNDPLSPMALAVLPNLDVAYIERAGKLKIWNQETGIVSVAGELDVNSGREDGLIGITLDPDFEENNWIYLFYSPLEGEKQHVSRFELINNELVMASEIILLEIPVQREQCCHSGGDLEFDRQGNLWIATGDNVNPFQSNGFAPIDEREGRAAFDAQTTSGNTNDLRGKVLRIKPKDDGTYTIPEGNLFSNIDEGLPEIYVMGVRNAFRIAVNEAGELVWGDVGPDAGANNTNRGPRGYDEVNRTSIPGNFGWPYAVADNKMYNDYDFATSTSGEVFDPNNLINDSPNNTGTVNLPPAIPAWIYYHNGNNDDRPEFNAQGGRSILGGVFFDYEEIGGSGLPRYYDDVLIVGDWSRNWFKEIRLDEEGNLLQINPFLPHLDLRSPIDIDIGPDGNIYIAEWGTGFTSDNADAKIIKVEYMSIAGNNAPIALISADVENGLAPLTVNFDASESRDPDIGDQISYSWDFNDDGVEDSNEVSPSYIFDQNGVFNSTLALTDQEGERSVAQIEIVVGNSAPRIEIESPVNGGFFQVFDTIEYTVSTSDAEDGIECDQNLPQGISVEPSIGHDDHSHGEGADDACFGTFITSPHGDDADDVFYILNAQYQDRGGEVEYPLMDRTFHVLQPKMKQAQYAQEYFDLRTESTGDFLGGDLNMAYINDNSYLRYSPMNFDNISFLTVRWAALNKDSRLEVHIDAPDGPIIAERSLPITGNWQFYDYYTMELNNPGGTHDVYFVFKKPGQTGLGNINFMEFHGKGISTSDHQEGMGLTATYYTNGDFTGNSIARNEPMISWDWDELSPVEGIPADGFSVKWQGHIRSAVSGIQKISAPSLNGDVRVWIDGQAIVTESISESDFEFVQDELYEILVTYSHSQGDAEMALRWEGFQPVNVIHTQYLRNASEMLSSIDQVDKSLDLPVFPNPFKDYIVIDQSLHKLDFEILTIAGQKVLQGRTSGLIDTTAINPGVYFISIGDRKYKIVKSD